MLLELRVENLLLIERAELRLGPGLNVLTGETGAGKTMLARALDLLLGGRPRPGTVRSGAEEAWVEGVFALPAGLLDHPDLEELRERLPEGEEELVLGRRVGASGRSRAFVQGRAASATDLRELGRRLLSFYGQHEHRRLALGSAQLEALDGFCGSDHLAARTAFADAHARARTARRALEGLRDREGARDRDRDLLLYEIAEIEELEPSEEDEAELLAARERLRHLDALRAAAGVAAEALVPEGLEPGAAALLAEGERLATAAAGADPELDALADRLAAVRIEADELGAELRRYAEGLEAEPGGLERVEERLERYERLRRKHGGTVASVIAHAERCRAEHDRLEGLDEALENAMRTLDEAEREERTRAEGLGATRVEAAPRLGERVEVELAELAMGDASFTVGLEPREGALGPLGAERVEFLVAANRGVEAAPVREIASGGELSRIMLALTSVASAGGPPTLVFDEVDSGVGGQTARAVGERLRALAAEHQVLCITHLPQIASLADHHFRVDKLAAGDLTRASVEHLDDPAKIDELCRMLGAEGSDPGARRHAEELLAAA